jgi:hypothetical protein
MNHLNGQTPLVYKQFFACLVDLSHRQLIANFPLVVATTECALAALPWLLINPFLPQECECHSFALPFYL